MVNSVYVWPSNQNMGAELSGCWIETPERSEEEELLQSSGEPDLFSSMNSAMGCEMQRRPSSRSVIPQALQQGSFADWDHFPS